MTFVKLKDKALMFYKDWGSGRPVIFSHGWPLSSDVWAAHMMVMAEQGFRCIAHDRRGHGRSSQSWDGNDMDTYADDLCELIACLDLKDAVLVGHSTGGGEVARVAARLGRERIAGVVLVSAVTPLMLRTDENPEGIPQSFFDDLRASVARDRSQLFRDFAPVFFGPDREGHRVTQGMYDQFWLQGMTGGLRAHHECVTAFSSTDFTADLERLSMPVLIVHGDDDKVVPLEITSRRAARIVPHATLKIYPGVGHALPDTAPDQFSADLLDFVRSI